VIRLKWNACVSDRMRHAVTALLSMLSVLTVAGCGGQSHDTSADASATEKPRIALIMKSLANEFFKTMEDGARRYAAEQPDAFTLVANGTQSEEDVAGQVALVEQMMAQSVDAIVIAPADSRALVGVLARASDAGIVVVNIDNKLDAETLAARNLQIPFVGPDNRAGARKAGEYLATSLAEGDSVAIIEGIPSAFNAVQRRLGFEDAMKAAGVAIVASQSANWEMAQANRVASGILSEHPDVKALLCANDSMALGAHAAARDAGRLDSVAIVGFDNIAAVRDLVRQGDVLCTVDQHGDELAVYGIEFALAMLSDGAEPEDKATPVDLITREVLESRSE